MSQLVPPIAQQLEVSYIPFTTIPQFSTKDVAYATGDNKLRPFYKYDVQLSSFEQIIKDKQSEYVDRATLVKVLKEQYSQFDTSDATKTNIDLLAQPNTFTIVTAHQPSLFTGHLYYIYKILSTINLCEQLNQKYPAYNFVPVFISGGEDHDFEEINHAHIFNKTVIWESEEQGAVGMMSTKTLQTALADLKDILGDSDKAQHIYAIIERAYTRHADYGTAALDLVNELFKAYGLVVLGMNHPELKRLLIPIIKEEIFNQPSQALIETTQQQLSAVGIEAQAMSRAINFFYLDKQLRTRIIEEDGIFKVLDTDLQFTANEMEQLIEQHPERFSPNVVMRPLYQEVILPNLAYIGGGGEIAYWLERRTQFEHFGVNFPMLIRRNSVLWMDKSSLKRMKKLSVSFDNLTEDVELIIKNYVKANTEAAINLKAEKAQIEQVFDAVIQKAKALDPTLAKTAKAEQAKQLNALSVLEGKLLRAEKQRHEISINQIRGLKDKFFPNNGLQERYDNFLSFYLKYGEDYFNILKPLLDPMREGMVLIEG